ncbi:RNA polymerase sigma factor [Candidatus Entotheonella palauensis]|uniref:RNA polymerase sigma factor n=1 Tax=Candidatus Entotheonella palauensis TaxID=93172 RepID=UPI000B7F7DF9|nr:RNA polymerase sigma factor [Candidatus Entotheonella palauensis]
MQSDLSCRTPSQDATDETLISRVAAGDAQAFEALYNQYAPRLRGYLQAQLGELDLAEEVCHDVMLVVWRNAGHFRHASRLSTWMFGIARRMARNAWRRAPQHTLSSQAGSEAVDPARHLEQQEWQHLLAGSLSSLPPVLRQTLRLRYDHDYTYRQIADEMGCAEGTVKQRLRQGHRRLAAHLKRRVYREAAA